MQSLLRLLIWPSVAGIAIALLILNFFPQYLPRQAANQDTANTVNIHTATPIGTKQSGPFSYASAVKKAAPAVVNIYTAKIIKEKRHPLFNDPFFREFFGKGDEPKRERMQSSLGSGVIISSEGYVLTNNHVIANADEIIVALRDGRESFAKVVGTDPETDLAVLRIDLPNIPTITLASSEDVEIGDVVLAIGNPFGVGQTVTMGIVSATGRNQLGLTTFEDFIQTDAAINPGNSGGALINPNGDLIGINTAIFSRSGGSQGIGFAIPTDLGKNIMQEIITHGSVVRGWLGVEVQPLTRELAKSFGLSNTNGVLVSAIHRNGPAYIAGLKPGDILIAVDSVNVEDGLQVMNQITMTKPGGSITMEVIREGKPLKITSLVGKRIAK